jgi:hypothetical protein
MAHDVFVSHSVKDETVADASVVRLEGRLGNLLDRSDARTSRSRLHC